MGKDSDAQVGVGNGKHIHKIGMFTDDVRLRPGQTEPAADLVNPGAAVGHDQRLSRQRSQGQRFLRADRQRMPIGQNGAPRLVAYYNALQMLAVVGGGDDAQFDEAPLDLLDDVVAATVDNLKAHQRVFLPEAGQPAGSQKGCPAGDAAKTQGAGQAHCQRADFLPGPLRQIQQLLCPAVKELSRLRQLQAPAAPDKQGSAQLLFQCPDLVAQGRLAHVQPLSRPGKIQFLGNHREVIQTAKIHAASSFVAFYCFRPLPKGSRARTRPSA